MILDYFPKINKYNRSEIKYFQNSRIKNINTYILSMLYIGSSNTNLSYEEKKFIGGSNKKINIKDYYNHIPDNILNDKLNDKIKKLKSI